MIEAEKAKAIERLQKEKWPEGRRLIICDRVLSKTDCIDEMMHETELGLELLDIFYNGAFVIDLMRKGYSLEDAKAELEKQKRGE